MKNMLKEKANNNYSQPLCCAIIASSGTSLSDRLMKINVKFTGTYVKRVNEWHPVKVRLIVFSISIMVLGLHNNLWIPSVIAIQYFLIVM